MGVPAFYRWLSNRYPAIQVHCVEEKLRQVDGTTLPVDCTKPNLNGVEFDNLYLDMNGIIHPCCHPEYKAQPRNEDEMMTNIFDYIDRLFAIVRPRRLLYMAIDGVAPRAKMNQQRSRRFRAAKEAAEKRASIAEVRARLKEEGVALPAPIAAEDDFDSNCITPGTPFMARLAICLRYYIHEKMNNDPAWKNIQVILSDANVPGEGEHKIMDFIRRQRASPSHDPNTHHCLCGADADLIMLGLATHEPNFTIIREEFIAQKQRPCELCGQFGHELKECQGMPRGDFLEAEDVPFRETNFIFLRISVLREYLAREMAIPNLPFEFNVERAIDDWVFMCFFVGNDFLPHLPSLEIREGAIDRLINLYKKTIYRTGGWLTDSGRVHLERVQLILTDLGEMEDEIFKRRQETEMDRKHREKERKKRQRTMTAPAYIPGGQFKPTPLGRNERPSSMINVREEAADMRRYNMQQEPSRPSGSGHWESLREREAREKGNQAAATQNKSNQDAAKQLKNALRGVTSTVETVEQPPRGTKRKHDQVTQDSDEDEVPDDVRLWETGWKERYYQAKFEVSANDFNLRYRVANAYAEGLCWVLQYYYQGCASWKWFYPFHYAPFASDFVNLGDLKIDFDPETKPFQPLEQLMGVFPAASKKHVPVPWSTLMIEPESPIIDFYPDDFKVDLNGKKFLWQGVALLPFVEEKRLLEVLVDVYPLLTDLEKARNVKGVDYLFVSSQHKCYEFLTGIYEDEAGREWINLDSSLLYGMSGRVKQDPQAVLDGQTVKAPITGCADLRQNKAIVVKFVDPQFPKGHWFDCSQRLPGAKTPPPALKPQDWNADNGERYYPQTGFTRGRPRAHLGDAGRRFVQSGMGGQGQYNQMPPPGGYRGAYGAPHWQPPPANFGEALMHQANNVRMQMMQYDRPARRQP